MRGGRMKRLVLLTAVLVLAVCLAAGCKSGKQQDAQEAADSSTLTGTLDEVKDFMFTVTDETGSAYVFPVEEGSKPKGLEDVSVGDTVTVTYSGTLSQVDGLDGSVLSVEKAES